MLIGAAMQFFASSTSRSTNSTGELLPEYKRSTAELSAVVVSRVAIAKAKIEDYYATLITESSERDNR